jgi:ligand-binding sensor domain-containing protein
LLIGALILSGCKPTVSSTTKPAVSPTITITSSTPDKLEIFTSGNQINNLLISGNELWAATTGGLVRWDIQKGTYRKYTVADGLPGNFAGSMTQDQQGNLWFTDVGVSRFDGTHFQNFTPKDGLVSDGLSITCDHKDNIITGGPESSLRLFDGTAWQIIFPRVLFETMVIRRLVVDNSGNIWAAVAFPSRVPSRPTTYSLRYFDGKSWHLPTEADGWAANYHSLDATTLAKAPDGNLCFVTDDDHSILEYNGKSWQTITPGNFNVSPAYITFDSQGTIWCADNTDLSAISYYDGKSWHTYNCDILPHNPDGFTAIAVDKNNNVWCGTNNGIFRFDGQSWQSYTTKDNLTNNDVRSLFTDNLGDIWFNTFSETTINVYSDIVKMVVPGYGFVNDGLTCYDGKTWQTFTQADGLPQDIVIGGFFQDNQGNIWVSAGTGQPFRYDGKTWQFFDKIGNDPIRYITQDKQDNLWFSGNDYVIRYDGKSWQKYTMNTAGQDQNSIVNDTAVDKQGNVWVSTSFGVRRFNGTGWQAFTTDDGLISNDVGKIFVDSKGRLWFAGRGIDLFDGQKWSSFKPEDPAAYVSSVAEDGRGNIWYVAGWNKGVMKYDGSNRTNITAVDGLAGNTVYSILPDGKGNLWFCTNNGLSFYDGKNWQSYAPNVDFYGQTIITKDGSLWSISGGGLIHFIPGNR